MIFKDPPLPKYSFEDLDQDCRKVFLALLRKWMASQKEVFRLTGYGFEKSEECMIELLNKGYFKIYVTEFEDGLEITLKQWNGEKYCA